MVIWSDRTNYDRVGPYGGGLGWKKPGSEQQVWAALKLSVDSLSLGAATLLMGQGICSQ